MENQSTSKDSVIPIIPFRRPLGAATMRRVVAKGDRLGRFPVRSDDSVSSHTLGSILCKLYEGTEQDCDFVNNIDCQGLCVAVRAKQMWHQLLH